MSDLSKYRKCIQSQYRIIDRDGTPIPASEIIDEIVKLQTELEAAREKIKTLEMSLEYCNTDRNNITECLIEKTENMEMLKAENECLKSG